MYTILGIIRRTPGVRPTLAVFTREFIEQRVGTLTDAAKFLHRDPSALIKLLARHPVDAQ